MWYISHVLTRKLGNCIYCIYIKISPKVTTTVVFSVFTLSLSHIFPVCNLFFYTFLVRKALSFKGFVFFPFLVSSFAVENPLTFSYLVSSTLYSSIHFLYIYFFIDNLHIYFIYLPTMENLDLHSRR